MELHVFRSWTENAADALDNDDLLGNTFPLAPHPPTKMVLAKAQVGRESACTIDL